MVLYYIDSNTQVKTHVSSLKDIFLKKRDIIGFTCDSCEKTIEQQYRFKDKFHQEKIFCNSCSKSLNNPFADPSIQNKIKQTKLSRYGNSHYTNREKAKQTMLSRYGTEHALQNEDIKHKTNKTNQEKYGHSRPIQDQSIYQKMIDSKQEKYGDPYYNNRDKFAQTMLQKYGGTNVLNSSLKEGALTTKLKKYYDSFQYFSDFVKPLFTFEEFKQQRDHKYVKLSWKCSKCGNVFEDYIANSRVPRCKKCFPIKTNSSLLEKEISFFLASLNIETKEHDRTILQGKEIDIYVPDFSLAIELDGLYWHGEIYGNKSMMYHLEKTQECENQKIHCVHIFEDEWIYKQNIVKSILSSKLGVHQHRIHARKCEVRYISSVEAKNFLNENHIQGFYPSKTYIGLYHEQQLVSVLSMGSSRYNNSYEWEITRFANQLYTSIPGSFSKLLKRFLIDYNPTSIITYSDKRYFTGSVYKKNGFHQLNDSGPSYWYVKNGQRHSRVEFQKHKLKQKLETYQEQLTEWQNMQLNQWDRIWDCGNAVYIYTFNA